MHHPELTFQQQRAAQRAADAAALKAAQAAQRAARQAKLDRKAAALTSAVQRLRSEPPATQADRWKLGRTVARAKVRQAKLDPELRRQRALLAQQPPAPGKHPDQCEAVALTTGQRCRKRKAHLAPDGRLLCNSHWGAGEWAALVEQKGVRDRRQRVRRDRAVITQQRATLSATLSAQTPATQPPQPPPPQPVQVVQVVQVVHVVQPPPAEQRALRKVLRSRQRQAQKARRAEGQAARAAVLAAQHRDRGVMEHQRAEMAARRAEHQQQQAPA